MGTLIISFYSFIIQFKEQGLCSEESPRLLPVWLGVDSWTLCHARNSPYSHLIIITVDVKERFVFLALWVTVTVRLPHMFINLEGLYCHIHVGDF